MSPKINNIGLGSRGHVPKSENRESEGLSFSHNEIEQLLVQNEAE